MVRLGKVSIAVKTFGVCDFSRLAVTDWRLRRWRLWFLALMTGTEWVAVISAKNHKRLRRKRQTRKVANAKGLTVILTLPNLTKHNLTLPNLI